MAEINQPIIIKKITIEEGGAHGGAWKVAYADFVTAMMAFFLLLWLLAVASEETKEGLAEYFTPTIGVQDSMGIGFDGGTVASPDGTMKNTLTPVGIITGSNHKGEKPENPEKDTIIDGEDESRMFEKAEKAIKQAFESDPNLRELNENIVVEQTPEGLKITMKDSDKYPMFKTGGAILSEYGKRILHKIQRIIKNMPNYISITGHTDAYPFSSNNTGGNWSLSTARANSARLYMQKQGMLSERTGKIVGMAGKELLFPNKPESPLNRRIVIILLRSSHMNLNIEDMAAPRPLLTTSKIRKPLEKKKTKNPIIIMNDAPAVPSLSTP